MSPNELLIFIQQLQKFYSNKTKNKETASKLQSTLL